MIAKLMGQSLRKPTERMILLEDGCTITNPTTETLVEIFGYKYVVETPKPSAPEGFYYDQYYEEDDEHIYRRWELKEVPSVEVVEEPIYEGPIQEASSDFERFNDILLGKEV